MGKNVFGLSTTGFNVNKEVFVDNSKLGSSSKYGKSAIQKSHPNWNVILKLFLRVLHGEQQPNKLSEIQMKEWIQLTDKRISFYRLRNRRRKTVDSQQIIHHVTEKDGTPIQFWKVTTTEQNTEIDSTSKHHSIVTPS